MYENLKRRAYCLAKANYWNDEVKKVTPAAMAEIKAGGTIRNTPKGIVYEVSWNERGGAGSAAYGITDVNGSIDWKAYALSIGGTLEGAEKYRKKGYVKEGFKD